MKRPNSEIIDGRIVIDESEIDLFCEPEKLYYEYKPRQDLKSYEDLSKIYIDIETRGLDPETCRIYMVGMVDTRNGETIIIAENEERETIVKTIDYLKENPPEVLVGHNHIRFDLPFIATRARLYNISVPWEVETYVSRITSASVFGKSLEYCKVKWKGVNIVDTYHQIAIWDKQAAKLEAYDLKSSVIALKLRDDRRLELNVHQIKECWASGDKDTIAEYLEYDLSDTKLLADFLLPTVYYQLAYIPRMTFQEISVANAVKFQKLYESLDCWDSTGFDMSVYPKSKSTVGIRRSLDSDVYEYHDRYEDSNLNFYLSSEGKERFTDEKVGYEGGISQVYQKGLHHNVAKIDVSSMYPSIMIRYGICSRKDPLKKSLSALKQMTDDKIAFGILADAGDVQAKFREKSTKVLINSMYGFLGVGFYTYNDMEAAAIVTTIGRMILRLMMSSIEAMGGVVIAVDTDGIIYSHPDTTSVYNEVTNILPSGIKIKLEFEEMGAYIPKAKNYVLVSKNGKLECKGLYRKRNRYPLQNKHPLEMIRRYFMEGKEPAIRYHEHTVIALKTRAIDIADLTITRKIGKAEKKLVELGLGQVGDKISYWTAEEKRFSKAGKPLKSKPLPTVVDKYWAEHYLNESWIAFIDIFGEEELNSMFDKYNC
jgi:DNA polymerase, archaea type